VSRRSYSKHIPDFRFVTFFAESGTSIVHRMSPWTKAALLPLLVAIVTVVSDVYWLAVIFSLTLAFYASSRLPLKVLVGWYTFPIVFVLTLAVLFIFTVPGDSLVSFRILGMTISLSDNGLVLVVALLLRALAVVTYSLALFMTTRYTQIAYLAFKTMPRTIANLFLLSYRFMFETFDEVSDVLDAMNSRNGGLVKGLSRQGRLFAGIIGLAFVHAFERGERIGKAMEARGWTGSFPITDKVCLPGAGGYALIAVAAAALAIAGYSRYFGTIVVGWW
jgi:cobalt/nickel transport system permease protein